MKEFTSKVIFEFIVGGRQNCQYTITFQLEASFKIFISVKLLRQGIKCEKAPENHTDKCVIKKCMCMLCRVFESHEKHKGFIYSC